MKWLLNKCHYEIQNPLGNNNKYPLMADIILLTAYTLLSVFNAIQIWLPPSFLNQLGIASGGSPPTVFVIVINFIVLIRLNVNLYIKSKNNKENELEKLRIKRQVVTELSINTWGIRMWIVSIGYIVDIIIGIFCMIFGVQLYSSLSGIVLVSIAETYFNSLVDNYEVRYLAIPKVYIRI